MKEITQIGPIKRIELHNYVQELSADSVIFVHQIGDTLIDTGSIFTSGKLVELLSSSPPKRIILSHQHEDHIGGVSALKKAYGDLEVHCPSKHIDIVTNDLKIPAYRQIYWGNTEPISEVIAFEDGYIFEDAGVQMTAIETPGHTVGHMSFLVTDKRNKYVLPGDLFLAEQLYMSFDESSVPDMLTSLRKILSIPSTNAMLPAHHQTLYSPYVEIDNLIEWYEKEIEYTEAACAELGSDDYVEVFLHRFKHLNKMEKFSRGALGRLALLRGILEPVNSLPAVTIRFEDVFKSKI